MDTLQKHSLIENGILHAEKKRIIHDFAPHQHDFFELEYILCGEGEYLINGTVYPIENDMIFFMTPTDFHSIKTTNTELINLMFSPEYIDTDALFRLVQTGQLCTVCKDESDQLLLRLMLSEIVSSFNSGNSPYALQFLSCVIQKLTALSSAETDSTPSHIRSVLLYLLENFRNGITLEQAAAHVGLAPAYLSSLFHDHMGVTFKQYLDQIRFEYALRLLSFTDLTILEVCTQSGFREYTNFTRRFKERFGITPKAYRLCGRSLPL